MKQSNLSSSAMSIALLTMTILLIAGIRQVQAGGCSRFGHSCFGAHGKRAGGDLPNSLEMSQPNFDIPSTGYAQGPGGYIPLPNLNNRRISPYLIDWLMSARVGEMKGQGQQQQQGNLKEEIQPMEMRKK
jgi:hypothetical protein